MKTGSRTVARRTPSIWKTTVELPSFPPLNENVSTDVCVVGAGIAGLSTAYILAKAGRPVVVIDDGPLCGGATQATTAHLTDAIDDRYVAIERIHGKRGARLAADSHAAAIDRIERHVRDEAIECEFERLDGFLFLPPGEPVRTLEHELAAARRAGVVGVELVARAPLAHFDTGPAIRFPGQAQFHPLKYLAGLVRAIVRDGGRFYTETHASEVKGGQEAYVTANGHMIRANAIVVATNTPISNRVVVHTRQVPYMTYVIGARVPKETVARALYWDTADPYHYIRLQDVPGSVFGVNLREEIEMLLVGGEDHKAGQIDDTHERNERLEEWARERFPTMGEVEFAWSGQVMETIDGLAFIGRNPADESNVYIATGDSGQGMTHGTIAGMILSDLILEHANAWTSLYDPGRLPQK